MKIGVGASTMLVECVELKDKILDYLKQKGIETVDAGPLSVQKLNTAYPLHYLESLGEMVKTNKINKGISICRMGVSATTATKNAGILDQDIAQQNVVEPHNLSSYLVLTVGTHYPWEETKAYIDSFIS